ncbi:MAG: hypothetical protein A2043_09540 [Candidatus Schekmanbacteria bacterium GWA2_38_9]|nr:MAG: hypothetical protein A2043_09540 [Candidatus Schekmanbacteria bacterium GWA2_38_9]
MKVFIKWLSACATRKAELEQYRSFLVKNGHEIVGKPQDSEVILLWTCGFRRDHKDNSLVEVKRYQNEYNAKLIVAGCLPDIVPQELAEGFSGYVINWRDDKKKMEEYFGRGVVNFDNVCSVFIQENVCEDVDKFRKENPNKDVTFHDQFIKILVSEGCNYKCTYCSEKLAFPPYRSFSENEIVEACRRMVEKTGCYEIILISDSLGDYGCDIGTNLPSLMHNLLEINPKLKIALNNFNPEGFVLFYEEISNFLAKGDIRHLNLPIQSASDRILKLMNRPYSRSDLDKIFGLLNEICYVEFDTHIIIGFPGETKDDINETVEFILKHKPKYVLASCYMETHGMESYNLSNKVTELTMRERLQAAKSRITAAGIICNTDDSGLSIDRFRRLNIA